MNMSKHLSLDHNVDYASIIASNDRRSDNTPRGLFMKATHHTSGVDDRILHRMPNMDPADGATAMPNGQSTSGLTDALRVLLKSCLGLSPALKNVLIQRHALAQEHNDYKFKRMHFRQSREAFVRQIRERPCELSESAPSYLESLQKQVTDDNFELDEQSGIIESLWSNLSDAESRMQQREEILLNATEAVIACLRRAGISLTAGLNGIASTPDESEPSRSSSPEVEPELAHFYDAFAGVNIMTERLNDLKLRISEDIELRNHREDQGESLQISWEAFQAQYREELVLAQSALDRAVEIEQTARADCEKHGFEISHYYHSSPEFPFDNDELPLNEIDAVFLVQSPPSSQPTRPEQSYATPGGVRTSWQIGPPISLPGDINNQPNAVDDPLANGHPRHAKERVELWLTDTDSTANSEVDFLSLEIASVPNTLPSPQPHMPGMLRVPSRSARDHSPSTASERSPRTPSTPRRGSFDEKQVGDKFPT